MSADLICLLSSLSDFSRASSKKCFTDFTITIANSKKLFNAIVLSVATNANDTWRMTSRIAEKVNVFQRRCLRRILQVSYRDHITNEILRRAGSGTSRIQINIIIQLSLCVLVSFISLYLFLFYFSLYNHVHLTYYV